MSEVQKTDLKNLPVSSDLHHRVKLQAARENRPMRGLTEEILQKGLEKRPASAA